ncbi:MAG: helix-turn-helix transcriptional regulator [Clostridia bacterium]|nr:helix-turn-helix transcriptional regulator [Clostridia bacterium]
MAVTRPVEATGRPAGEGGGEGAGAADLAAAFRALGDPHRLQVVRVLARGTPGLGSARGEAVCACDLEALTGLAQPTVSYHMRVLTEAGLVRATRCGRWTYYEVLPEALEAVSRALAGLAARARAARLRAHPAGSASARAAEGGEVDAVERMADGSAWVASHSGASCPECEEGGSCCCCCEEGCGSSAGGAAGSQTAR